VTQLVEDYVLLGVAAVVTASVIVMGASLLRYKELVKDASTSATLAKDLWEAVNARFSVLDGRIVDLMAKTEVLSSRVLSRNATSRQSFPGAVQRQPVIERAGVPPSVREALSPLVESGEGTETEERVLRFLVQGPRTSAQIKQEVGRSREHTARLMKALFDRGLVIRDDGSRPYLYEITERGRTHVGS
jgi:hypothetical protein